VIPSGVYGSSDLIDGEGFFQKFFKYGHVFRNFSDYQTVDQDGNVIYTVNLSTTGDRYQPSDSIINKISPTGKVLWSKILQMPVWFDYIAGITSDSSGNIFVVGAHEAAHAYRSIFVVKISPSGSILWQKSTNTGVYNIWVSAMDIKVADSGNIYVSGSYSPSLQNFSDRALTIKLDSSGNFVWGRSFQTGGTSANSPYVLTLDSSENVYTQSVHASPSRVLSKLNSNGTLQFRVANPYLATYNMATDPSGNSYFVTEGLSTVTALARINTNGTQTLRVTAPSTHKFKDVAVDSSGNVYVVGTSFTSEQVVEIAKFSTSGGLLWSRALSSPSFPSSTNTTISIRGNTLYLLIFGADGSPQTILCKLSVENGMNLGVSIGGHRVENVTITANVTSAPKTYSSSQVPTSLNLVSAAPTTESFSMVNTAFSLVDSLNGEFYNRSFVL
jgi:hypothetical protein